MSDLVTAGTSNVRTLPMQTGRKETLVLLEEFASLNFMLHTHHPMTHVARESGVNVRQECGQDRVPVVASA